MQRHGQLSRDIGEQSLHVRGDGRSLRLPTHQVLMEYPVPALVARLSRPTRTHPHAAAGAEEADAEAKLSGLPLALAPLRAERRCRAGLVLGPIAALGRGSRR